MLSKLAQCRYFLLRSISATVNLLKRPYYLSPMVQQDCWIFSCHCFYCGVSWKSIRVLKGPVSSSDIIPMLRLRSINLVV